MPTDFLHQIAAGATPFEGSPAFVIFGFLMVLSNYLRNVAVTAQDLIDKMEGKSSSAPFPYLNATDEMCERKILFQKQLRKRLAAVMHILFFFMLFIALRIVFSALDLNAVWPEFVRLAKFLWDLAISITLTILVLVMWIMHWRSREEEQSLKEEARHSQKPADAQRVDLSGHRIATA